LNLLQHNTSSFKYFFPFEKMAATSTSSSSTSAASNANGAANGHLNGINDSAKPVRDAAKAVLTKAQEYKAVQYTVDTVTPYIPERLNSTAQQYGTPALDIADEQVGSGLDWSAHPSSSS
jgi:hypothetical protein